MKAVALFFLLGVGLTAQMHWAGEFEFTKPSQGRESYDLYLLGHNPNLDVLGRVFVARGGLKRSEFAGGKSFNLLKDKDSKPRLTLVPYLGITTDGAAFIPLITLFNFPHIKGHYIVDPKLYLHGKARTLYQETTVGLTRSGNWQLRWERLDVKRTGTVFDRFGFERRFFVQTGSNSHVPVSIFYDKESRTVGIYIGFRW